MRLGLTFAPGGMISGEGDDDIAPFTIEGVFDTHSNEATWTKQYMGMHHVKYRGLFNSRSICGTWTLGGSTGGFWIWPHTSEEVSAEETVDEWPEEELVPV